MWIYESSMGILRIIPTIDGRYGFVFNDTVWEASLTPQAEADNVYCHVTGCYEWDLSGAVAPTDLSEWEFIELR